SGSTFGRVVYPQPTTVPSTVGREIMAWRREGWIVGQPTTVRSTVGREGTTAANEDTVISNRGQIRTPRESTFEIMAGLRPLARAALSAIVPRINRAVAVPRFKRCLQATAWTI